MAVTDKYTKLLEKYPYQRADVDKLLEQADEFELSAHARVRLKCVLHYFAHGENATVTCRRFGICRTTFYNWLKKVNLQDPSSLENQSKAPKHRPQPETDARTIALIEEYRRREVFLNKEKISARLLAEHGISASASTVGRVINRHGFYFADTPLHREKRLATESQKGSNAIGAIRDDTAKSVRLILEPADEDQRNSGWQKAAVIVLTATAASFLAGTKHAYALERASYQLHPTFPNRTAGESLEGLSFAVRDGAITDTAQPLHGSVYQITVPSVATSSSSQSSSSPAAISSSSTVTPAGGGRRTTPPSPSPSSALSSARSSASTAGAPAFSSVVPSSFSAVAAGPSPVASTSVTEVQPSEILHCPYRENATLHEAAPQCPCTSLSAVTGASVTLDLTVLIAIIAWAIGRFGCVASCTTRHKHSTAYRRKHVLWKQHIRARACSMKKTLVVCLLSLALLLALLWNITRASAATTVPLNHWYQGHLLSSSGNPVTTAVTIRLSYWKSADFTSGDLSATGAINTSASNYVNWYEEHTLTPSSDGSFAVELGSIHALPDLSALPASTLTSLYLQVDVKASGAADSTYDLQDADTSSTTIDRTSVLSLPFARNADFLDQRDVGTGSGSIPLLQSGGLLPISTIAGGTHRTSFILNANGSTATGALFFGGTLSEYLRFNTARSHFEFSDNLWVEGNLSTSGSLIVEGNMTFGSNGSILRINNVPYTFPFGDGSASGRVLMTSGSGQLTWGLVGTGSLKTRTRSLAIPTDAAAITTDGSNNETTVYVGSETGSTVNPHQYYRVSSGSGQLQDVDIRLKVLLPADFVSFANAGDLRFAYKNTGASTAQSKLDILVEDADGDDAFTAADGQNLFSTSWTEYSDELDAVAFNPSARQFIYITMKGYATTSGSAYAGDIILTYTSR